MFYIFNCWFNNYQECNSSDFTWSWDEFYGNCFTFNSGFDSNGNKMDLAGPLYGFTLSLYVNVYEKLIRYNGEQFIGFGAVIRIGNSSYSTYYSFGDGLLASAGFKTNIIIDREFKSMLPKPYSNCEIDSNLS